MSEGQASQAVSDGADLDPLVGTSLGGRYAIERVIGWGGMGVVYLARDGQENDREVVIKVLARRLFHDEMARQRFDREAESLKSLRHPNIVEMYSFERDGDRGYIVMEYLDGDLLSSFLDAQGPLAVEVFVPIAAQVLKGVGYAHSRELVLRDIKPENMMLCERSGRSHFVKMLDFGLAKLLHDSKKITKEEVIGTIGYIAPEVIAGRSADLRADVYALGVMFYRMLADRLPFPSDTQSQAALLYKTVNDEAPTLADVLPPGHEVPQKLVELVDACLDKEPDRRPADANVVVERLIDAVPTSLFRLPQSTVLTGPLLTRAERKDRLATPGSVPVPSAPREIPLTPELSTEQVVPHSAEEDEPAPSNGRGGLWIGLAAVALLGVGVAVGLGMSGSEDETTGAAVTQSSRANPKDEGTPSDAAAAKPAAKTRSAVADGSKKKARAAPAHKAVEVSSQPPGATVFLDGEEVGKTPFAGSALPGEHEITVRAEGYAEWSNTITVGEDEGATPIEAVLETESSSGGSRHRSRSGRHHRRKAAASTPVQEDETPVSTPKVELFDEPKKKKRAGVLLGESKPSDKKSSLLLPGGSD